MSKLFESESLVTSMEAWRKHMTGLEALVSLRGPQNHRSPLGRALLEEFRASLASLAKCELPCAEADRPFLDDFMFTRW